MSSVIVAGDTSGSVTLQAPAVAGTTVLTLPTTSGTVVVNNGAQTIEFADGSASAPSITNSGDTNTGIFFPAADTIAFAEGGAEAMRIDSSGNLGLGVTPSAWSGVLALQTNGGSLYSYLTTDVGLTQNGYWNGAEWKYVNTATSSSYFQSGGTHNWRTAPSGTAGNAITYVDRMKLDINGNLFVGTGGNAASKVNAVNTNNNTTDSSYFWFNNATVNIQNLSTTANSLASLSFYMGAGNSVAAVAGVQESSTLGALAFYTGGSGRSNTVPERMRIDSTGRLMVNQTSASAAGSGSKCQIATDVLATGSLAGFFFENRSGGVTAGTNWYGWYSTGTIYMYNGGGNIASINASTGAYTALSDVNKKKDFEPSLLGLNEILKLKPTLYRMQDAENDSPKELGLIAQEVQDVIPQAYFENTSLDAVGKESTFIGLNDRAIVATLVKAIQELKAIVDTQAEQIKALQGAA